MMATQHGSHVIVKGAPECLLELCDDAAPRRLVRQNEGSGSANTASPPQPPHSGECAYTAPCKLVRQNEDFESLPEADLLLRPHLDLHTAVHALLLHRAIHIHDGL
jgi:hypothetical protein